MNEFLIRKAKKGDKDAFCRLMDEQVQIMQRRWRRLMGLRQKEPEILLPTVRREIRQKAIRQGKKKLPQMLRQQKKIPPTPKPLTV